MAKLLTLALLILFACFSSVALAFSIWTFTQISTESTPDSERFLLMQDALRGPPGEPGNVGPAGHPGRANDFRGVHQWNVPWRAAKQGSFIQFEADAHGFFCPESDFGQITIAGEMQVRNPPNGRHSVIRVVDLWIPHDSYYETLLPRSDFVDRKDLDYNYKDHDYDHDYDYFYAHDWEIGSRDRNRIYTGWRSSDTVGAVTHDDQEDFEVICHHDDEDDDDHDTYNYRVDGDRVDRDDFYHRDFYDRDHYEQGKKKTRRRTSRISFNIIVTQGDEQVGITPFETVLPLHKRRACRLLCDKTHK
jgi:hypothetical protein